MIERADRGKVAGGVAKMELENDDGSDRWERRCWKNVRGRKEDQRTVV